MEEENTAIDLTLLEALLVYFDFGLDPGSCGMAVLLHDVELATRKAHEHSRHAMGNMVTLVSRLFPQPCHGSKERVDAWLKQGGQKGWDTPDGVLFKLDDNRQAAIKDLKRTCNYHQM